MDPFDGCLIWLPYYSVQANVAVHFFEAPFAPIDSHDKTYGHIKGVLLL